ncbi:MAG: alginate lyase family protein [bacterium]
MSTGLLTERATTSASTDETRADQSNTVPKITFPRPAEAAHPLKRFPLLVKAVSQDDFVVRLSRMFPEECARIVTLARAALLHQVTTLGGFEVWLGEEIDWQRDPRTGKQWQQKGPHRNCTCRCSSGADQRRVRALSRFQHLVPLALASQLETRADYANEAEMQIRSWIAQNPVGKGINWTSPAESAIRAINWLQAYQIVDCRWPRNPEFADLLLRQLTRTGAFIRSHLQSVCHGFNDYHYLANLVGLLYLGELRSDLRSGREWRDFALRELESEALHQFDNDGLLRQSSLAYHGFAAELVMHALLLESRCDWSFTPSFRQRFGKMLEVLSRYLQPDGTILPWGDSEELRLTNWCGGDPRVFRDVVRVGRRLLNRGLNGDCVSAAEEYLAFGGQQCESPRAESASTGGSYHLESSGLCRLQTDLWQIDFLADTQRTNPTGTHQHNDLLSLTARFAGQEVLIDPGTFSYSSGEPIRREFRGTAAHNTIMIDGQEQRRAVTNLPFVLRPDATARVSLWQQSETADLAVAEHDGYRRLDDPVRHRRALYLDRKAQILLIKDELRGDAEHQVEINFHTGDLQLTPLDSRNLLLRLPQGESLLLVLLSSELQFEIKPGWRSPAYDRREPSLLVSTRARLRLSSTLLCAFAPCDCSEPGAAHALIREATIASGWL